VRFERNEEGEICLYLPRRKDRFARALMFIFRAPPEKEIVLDEVGSDVWELCDGENSVEAIVSVVSKKYKVTRRECETSIGVYLKTLGERHLVGLRMPPKPAKPEPASNRPRKIRRRQ
ncbi:MAG: PqqD family protein, partial [Coriobacteriia bacterium]|nr:PqqD family protein [Coriobacteriia bacterium]